MPVRLYIEFALLDVGVLSPDTPPQHLLKSIGDAWIATAVQSDTGRRPSQTGADVEQHVLAHEC